MVEKPVLLSVLHLNVHQYGYFYFKERFTCTCIWDLFCC